MARALRPRQWLKNSLVVVPLVSSVKFFDGGAVARTGIAFGAFSLAASAVYLVNDVLDREQDRLHPRKSRRPVAAGTVSPGLASAMAAALAAAALALAQALGSTGFKLILASYFVVNAAYSLGLKRVFLLDTLIVASGFFLRVLAGAYAISVYVSQWLFVVTLFVSLAVSLLKRRAELTALNDEAARHRTVLAQYSTVLLDQFIAISISACLIGYALYTFNSPHSNRLMLTIPFFVYALFRYLYLVYERGMGEQPEEIVLQDRPFQINLVLFAAAVLAILAWFG
jgi:4-hydroxybenzoate polyprenyltransferase